MLSVPCGSEGTEDSPYTSERTSGRIFVTCMEPPQVYPQSNIVEKGTQRHSQPNLHSLLVFLQAHGGAWSLEMLFKLAFFRPPCSSWRKPYRV